MNKIIELLKIDDNYYLFSINLLAFIIISIIIYFLVKCFKNSQIKYIIPFLNALLLTFFTIFYSGDIPILFSEQVSLYQYISFISKDLFNLAPASELLKKDSPIFVDISYDQALINNEEKNESWNSKLTVTDRKKLTTFFKLINPLADSLVDIVVCDLLFTRSSDDPKIDKNLSKQIHLLNKKGKIILAQSKIEDGFSIITDQNNNILQRANVDIKKYFGNSFFTVTTQTDNLHPSLPYLLYLKLDSIPKPRNRSNFLLYKEGDSYAVNSFVPNIIFNTNSLEDEEEDNNGLQNIRNSIYQSFYLGQSIDTLQSGFHLFYETLKENKKQNKRNILIIGTFEDPMNDTHETLAGSMHGPILLFNIFLNYRSKAHIISLGFILYLFIGFSFISFLNFSSGFIKDNFSNLDEFKTSIFNRKRSCCKKIIAFLIQKNLVILKNFTRKIIFPFIGSIFNLYTYLSLFLFLTTAIIYFHHFINIIAVSIYFFILDKVLAVFIPNYDKH